MYCGSALTAQGAWQIVGFCQAVELPVSVVIDRQNLYRIRYKMRLSSAPKRWYYGTTDSAEVFLEVFRGGKMEARHDVLLLKDLDVRRRDLGLSYELLAKRCGVSRPTVQRILSGRHPSASFANIVAIAESLGLAIRDPPQDSKVDPGRLRREQAERKARKLVALVQGTSGLEGQAVDRVAVESMVEQTTHELLAGPKRKLWSDD